MPLTEPIIVGILNVTPDSFSDGGEHDHVDAAVARGLEMIEQGASVIDVGGESTRPGAMRVDTAEQIRRVVEPIRRLRNETYIPISIDTTRREVAEAALDAGATMINDVSAGRDDEHMFKLASERQCPIILMHMLGEPATMQRDPTYEGDVVDVVLTFLLQRAELALAASVEPKRIILDPGIGFGKTLEHNLKLLANLDRFCETGHDVMLGSSRKRFIHMLCGDAAENPNARTPGTVATTTLGVAAGVSYFRVHDVFENAQAAKVAHAVFASKL